MTQVTVAHDIELLDRQIGELVESLRHLTRIDDLEEIRLKVLPRPGWTTPAEFALVSAILGALRSQVDAAAALKRQLVEASYTIGV